MDRRRAQKESCRRKWLYGRIGGWGRRSGMANGRKQWTEKRETKSCGTFKAVGVTNARDACLDSPC